MILRKDRIGKDRKECEEAYSFKCIKRSGDRPKHKITEPVYISAYK